MQDPLIELCFKDKAFSLQVLYKIQHAGLTNTNAFGA